MHILGVRISGFKGVDVELPWASALVLFGKNDSGKTNILEALVSQLDMEQAIRHEPLRAGYFGREAVMFVFELDGLGQDGHPDREAFLSWFVTDNTELHWSPLTGDDGPEPFHWRTALDDLRAEYGFFPDAEERRREAPQLPQWAMQIAAGAAGLASADEAGRLRRFSASHYLLAWHGPPTVEGEEQYIFVMDLDALGHGWPSLDSLLDPLGLRVIRIEPRAGGDDALFERLEDLLESLVMYPPSGLEDESGSSAGHDDGYGNPWIVRRGGLSSLRPRMRKLCAAVAARVNDLAPPFVSEAYEVSIVPLPPDEWDMRHRWHVAVRLRSRSTGEQFDISVASSGISTWTGFALSEAIRAEEEALAARRPGSGGAKRPLPTTVYVFDEPETHLHPLAQEEAAAWVAERARSGAHVILASHAVPFLRMPMEDVEYLMVTRSSEWKTEVKRITGDLLGEVSASAERLGLPPAALIQVTRAWLVVEGEHDRLVLESFFGPQLRAAGIQIQALRGARQAKASFLNLGVLKSLGFPFFCLLDNTRAEAVRKGLIDAADMSGEEKITEQLIRLSADEGVQLTVLGLPFPDIICALPFEALRQVAVDHGGRPEDVGDWEGLFDAYRRRQDEARARGKKAPSLKAFVLDTLGVHNLGADGLVVEALRASQGRAPAGSPLAVLVKELVAAVGASTGPRVETT